MTKQNSNRIDRRGAGASRGVTLVELLVVISILAVVSAMMIPKLRMINKDRNIREAARVVASAFSKASSRAINDGSAGLMIVPNPNFIGPTSFETSDSMPYFAGTRIYQMRKLPAYIGDDDTAVATIAGSTVTISPTPFETGVIQANDEISFNGSSYRYRILSVSGASMRLDTNISAPMPEFSSGVAFVVHRQPRRLESSVVELPDGYLIDLRYSGPLVDGVHGTYLNQTTASPTNIWMQFDANGGVSRLYFDDPVYHEGNAGLQPTGSLNWLVTNFDPNAIDLATGKYKAGSDPIFSPSNKWVTIDSVTGSVNVASAAVPSGADFDKDGSVTLVDHILESREIADGRQSAGQ